MDAEKLNLLKQISASFMMQNKKRLATYHLLVEDLCHRQATENELEHCLDRLLDFVGDKEIQKLFNRLCQHYLPIYPDCIAFYTKAYKEETQEDTHEEN